MFVGTPSLDEFYAITSRRSRDYIRALPIRKKRPFPTLFPHASADAIDFLSKTLVSNLTTICKLGWDLTPTDFRSKETYNCWWSSWTPLSFCLCSYQAFWSIISNAYFCFSMTPKMSQSSHPLAPLTLNLTVSVFQPFLHSVTERYWSN